jgi:triacylglycerol esterase/lipase EstA (alpha/beta hydrolase family)
VFALRVVLAYAVTVVAGSTFYVVTSYLLAFARPAGPRPARLLRAIAVELVTTLALLPWWPLFLVLGATYEAILEGEAAGREGEAAREGTARSRERHPVILLHGFAMNRTQWLWMGRRLARLGRGPLHGLTYFSLQSVARSACHLQRFVEQVRTRERAARVDIVAHSLGGVVARYYVERLGGAAHVRSVITIGSPHHGTTLGRLAPLVPSARETGPGSRFLDDLGPMRAASASVRYTSIWSRADAIIVPPDSASIAPAGEDLVYDDLGHLSLILSPRVVDAVAARLAA